MEYFSLNLFVTPILIGFRDATQIVKSYTQVIDIGSFSEVFSEILSGGFKSSFAGNYSFVLPFLSVCFRVLIKCYDAYDAK